METRWLSRRLQAGLKRGIAPLIAALLLMMPTVAGAQDAPTLDANLTDSCVTEYDPEVDYFPDEITLDYTEGFTVAYFNHYKVVTVTQPWFGATEDSAVTYVLVQCGTPAPDGYADATVIETPVESFAALSTTYLPYVDSYGLVDRLIGVDTLSTTTTPSVVDKGAAGDLVELAPNYELNIETAIELDPQVVFTYGFGFETDSYLQLQDAGLTVVLNGEFAETSPLARAEWGKFLALFFNDEAEAREQFDAVADRYNELADLAAAAGTQPTVFVNAPFEGTWYMAGGQTYIAQFLADAGADYLWSDDESTTTLFLDFEAVFERAAEADFWVNADQFWFTLDDVIGADSRYGGFAAVDAGNVWSNNLALTESFGNDFYESGVAYPDRILADLIAIFHPDLLPDHTFVYYRALE